MTTCWFRAEDSCKIKKKKKWKKILFYAQAKTWFTVQSTRSCSNLREGWRQEQNKQLTENTCTIMF